MKHLVNAFKKETVLCIAIVLAVISCFIVMPDEKYLDYIDYRTLSLLFSLMLVVAGLRGVGVFDIIAGKLLTSARTVFMSSFVLVMSCFVFSMFITNDVCLITFVPLAIICFNSMDRKIRDTWMLPVIVMQTLAANLGSMLTPIGNPQNLYLYGQSHMSLMRFMEEIAPYCFVSALLLIIWMLIFSKRHNGKSAIVSDLDKGIELEDVETDEEVNQTKEYQKKYDEIKARQAKEALANAAPSDLNKTITPEDEGVEYASKKTVPFIQTKLFKIVAYAVLFSICLLVVGRLIPYYVALGLCAVFALIFDRKTLGRVDYALLGTFAALFIFIGNIGRIPAFHTLLQNMIEGREVITAVGASQVISNVPAALLLSGFTSSYRSLIIGTNIGGLGTLIASMASLISFKAVAKEDKKLRGRYFLIFTAANVIFLAALLIEFAILK